MVDEPSSLGPFLDALNTHDLSRVGALLAADFVFEEAASAGRPSTEAFLDELRMLFDGFPDMTFRAVRETAVGNRTYVAFHAMGTHQGEFLGVPASGKRVFLSGVLNLQIEDGTIRSLRHTIDFGGLRRQVL
jgi:steroid delta-isomerase-like uncharacterized protein